jgi:hypothetical protein
MSQRIIERAWRAYLTADGLGAERPTSRSGVETVAGLTYAVLRGPRSVLAVYRLTNRGKLRRLKQWPLSLTDTDMGREATRKGVDAAHSEAVPA